MRKEKTLCQKVGRLWSLMVGLKVTGKNFVQPQITVHYPRQTVDNISTFKGHIQLVGKPKEPSVPKCICCMLCVTSCPSGCIKVVKTKPPKEDTSKDAPGDLQTEKKEPPKAPKTPSKWILDFNTCSLCGTCAEVCPVKSIEYSCDVYSAGFSRQDFVYDLLDDLKVRAAAAPAPKKAEKKASAAEPAVAKEEAKAE